MTATEADDSKTGASSGETSGWKRNTTNGPAYSPLCDDKQSHLNKRICAKKGTLRYKREKGETLRRHMKRKIPLIYSAHGQLFREHKRL
jgi:hypothetical protein